MPVVFRHRGVRFLFFSNEGDPREPVHVHADGPDGSAKFWLYPEVHVARSTGFSRRQLAEMTAVVAERRTEIERAWDEFFG